MDIDWESGFFGIGLRRVLIYVFVLLIFGTTFAGTDRDFLAQLLAESAEITFFALLFIVSVFCIWRVWKFYRHGGSIDGVISGIFIAMITASFVSDYNPRHVASLLGQRVDYAKELFSILIIGTVVIIAFLIIVDIYNKVTGK